MGGSNIVTEDATAVEGRDCVHAQFPVIREIGVNTRFAPRNAKAFLELVEREVSRPCPLRDQRNGLHVATVVDGRSRGGILWSPVIVGVYPALVVPESVRSGQLGLQEFDPAARRSELLVVLANSLQLRVAVDCQRAEVPPLRRLRRVVEERHGEVRLAQSDDCACGQVHHTGELILDGPLCAAHHGLSDPFGSESLTPSA